MDEDVTASGVITSMTKGLKKKTIQLQAKLGKLTTLSNPNLRKNFLAQVYSQVMFFALSSFMILILEDWQKLTNSRT
jgi:hypothetical protein